MEKERYLNYAKLHRRTSGLSQKEVAQLAGLNGPHFIRQLEHCNHVDALSKFLAYQVIFGKPIDEIFTALTKHISQEVFKRIIQLSNSLEQKTTSSQTNKKLRYLEEIARTITNKYK